MKTGLSKVILAVVVLVLASLACSAVAPGGSPVPVATLTPVVSGGNGGNGGTGGNEPGNNNGGDVAPPSGRPLFKDDFKGRDSNWGTGTDSDSSVEYANDALGFSVYSTNYFVYSTPNDTDYTNVHVEVTAQNSSADKNAAFGIMCSQQFMDDDFYYVYITPAGDYGIVKSALAKDDVDLVTGSSDLIPQTASSYQIGLDCGNGAITLYINGQRIDSATDAEYTTGKVALFAWSDEVANGVTVSYDDFTITALP